jgi:hypothetical protein
MKPLIHAKKSAHKFGGEVADYIEIHNWFDQTKAHIADSRHRLVLHNSFGIFLCEQVFGEIVQTNSGEFKRMPYITNSVGKQVCVRDIAEQHVLDDLGEIPTLGECLQHTPVSAEHVGGSVAKMVMSIPKNSNYYIVD